MLETNFLLEDEERVFCELYGLEQHLQAKYPFYHGHVETYKDIFEATKKMSKDERKEVCRKLAELVGNRADLDLDFLKKLRNENIKENEALKLKRLLGMLAVEYYLSGTISATAG